MNVSKRIRSARTSQKTDKSPRGARVGRAALEGRRYALRATMIVCCRRASEAQGPGVGGMCRCRNRRCCERAEYQEAAKRNGEYSARARDRGRASKEKLSPPRSPTSRLSDMAGHERGQLHHRRASSAPLGRNRVLREDARKAAQHLNQGLDATAACRCQSALLHGRCWQVNAVYICAWHDASGGVSAAIDGVASENPHVIVMPPVVVPLQKGIRA